MSPLAYLRRSRALAFLLLIFASQAALGAEAGHVTRLRGAASAETGGVRHELSQDAVLLEGDRVTTGHDSRLEITLADGTIVTLGDDSDLKIDQFVYDPAANKGSGALKLTAGVFRAVTGGLAKLPGEPLHVSTPVATIGIRGTDFWGEQRADHLLLALLGGRAVIVETKTGRVEITRQNFATRVAAPGAAPSEPFELKPAELSAALATVAW
jgi:hypothetical protein